MLLHNKKNATQQPIRDLTALQWKHNHKNKLFSYLYVPTIPY